MLADCLLRHCKENSIQVSVSGASPFVDGLLGRPFIVEVSPLFILVREVAAKATPGNSNDTGRLSVKLTQGPDCTV